MHLWSLRQQENKNYNESVSDLSLDVINTTNETLNSLKSEIKVSATQSEIMANFASPERIEMEGWFILEDWYKILNNWSKQLPTNRLSDEVAQEIASSLVNNTLNMAA